MQSVSQAYKDSMKHALRERGYLTVYIGVVNLEAQKSAHVNEDEVFYLSGVKQPFTGQMPDKLYALPEENFSKLDGSMFFEPESGSYYNQGIISSSIKGSVTVYLDMEYDLKGLTILFGDCYPTEFMIQTDAGTSSYNNNAQEWHTEDTFNGISWIKITPTAMVNGNGRMRILQFTSGTSATIPVNKIQSYSLTDVVSPISESLPTQDMKLELSNVDGTYNVDDSGSIINYFETGQELQVIFAYDVAGDGVLEYTPPQTLYLKNADATDQKATFSATDRFRLMDGTYYGGRYHNEGISLYDLAVDVCQDAGLKTEEYAIDPYLKKVTVYNPLPVCRHPEALQIIANAGRCVVMFNRKGQIQLKSSFIPDVTVAAENDEAWSNPPGVLTDVPLGWYASPEYALTNGSVYFVPETGDYTIVTGFVSIQAEQDGTFTLNPALAFTMESAFSCFGFKISFHDDHPEEFEIHTYLQGVEVEKIICRPEVPEYVTTRAFAEFDVMKIIFTRGKPYRRIMVEAVQFGDITDYRLTVGRDLLSVPKAKKQDTIQAVSVTRTIYSQGTELKELSSEESVEPDEEGYYTIYLNNACYGYVLDCDVATIVESSCWYVKLSCTAEVFAYTLKGYEYSVTEGVCRVQHNPSGVVKTWKNELISSPALASDLEEWLAAHYMSDMEYEVSYRGDPRIDANDLFDMEIEGREPVRIRAYSHTLKYGGSWDGSMKVRRVV